MILPVSKSRWIDLPISQIYSIYFEECYIRTSKIRENDILIDKSNILQLNFKLYAYKISSLSWEISY